MDQIHPKKKKKIMDQHHLRIYRIRAFLLRMLKIKFNYQHTKILTISKLLARLGL